MWPEASASVFRPAWIVYKIKKNDNNRREIEAFVETTFLFQVGVLIVVYSYEPYTTASHGWVVLG